MHSQNSGLNSPAGLTVWRHKEGQREKLGAAGVPAAKAMQLGAAGEAGQGGEVEAAGAEGEDLPPVHHTAWGAGRLRALDGALGAKTQPKGCCWGS